MAEVRTTPGTHVALTIAGSDSSGGAGIQADLKTFTVLQVYGASVITAVTAQNTMGVKASVILEPDMVDLQIAAVAGDLKVNATKTGMLGNAATINIVAKAINRLSLFPLVLDPVMVAKSGDSLMDDSAVSVLVKKLLPLAAVVTPNRIEAGRLLGQSPVTDIPSAANAAQLICRKLGAAACIVKGIKRANAEEGEAVDVFFDGKQVHEIVSAWRPTTNTHGSGCTFSAAITASLAKGEPLEQAVQTAKALITEAIRQATSLGQGNGPVNHLAYLNIKK